MFNFLYYYIINRKNGCKGTKTIWKMKMKVENNEKDVVCSPFLRLTKCQPNHAFCLHLGFWQAHQNRIKRSRWHFCTLFQFDALKSNLH